MVSLRPEFLENSTQNLTEKLYKNIYSKVYKIAPLSNRDTIRLFKSLKLLKRLDRRLQESEQRHQKRYPPMWQEHTYIRLLRTILKENPDSLFRYPMYVRYAYMYMQEYRERQATGDKLELKGNFSVSFDVLVHAIIKWEFHIYNDNKSSELYKDEMERFKNKIEQCAQEIAITLAQNRTKQKRQVLSLSRKEFMQIICQYFSDEISYLAIAHCFMVSDDKGESFSFSHQTFYDYFLAKYLFEKADYTLRKKNLLPYDYTNYYYNMYYSILCQKKS